MNNSLEGRIEQRIAGQHARFQKRIAYGSFVGCLVLAVVYLAWFAPESIAQLDGPRWLLVAAVACPALAALVNFALRIALSPFIESYYRLFRLKTHSDMAVAEILGEELTTRAPGYLARAQELLRTYHPAAYLVIPEAHQAFKRLLDAEQVAEAVELGEKLGLSHDTLNQARRRVLGHWENASEESEQVQEIRKAASEVLVGYEAIESLVAGLTSGEVASTKEVARLLDEHAAQMAPLSPLPGELLARFLPAATVLRLSRIHELLGQAYSWQRDLFAARHHLERATELDPQNRQTRLLLSRAYYEHRNFPVALAIIESHLAQFPDDLVAKLHREDCLAQLGR
jgi:tetratricopeptide (TPR) repeat protein